MSPLLLVLIVIGSLFSFLYIFHGLKTGRKLPPGPRGLPIIDNLHMLGNLPHQSLYRLAKKHGEIMPIKLGYKPTIVVSSTRAAKLFLKTHDTIFVSRPLIQTWTCISYGVKGVVFTPYGPYWRYVRKLCTLHLLSAAKIEYFVSMRKEEIGLAVDSIKKAVVAGEVVDLSMKMADMLHDMTCRMIFGQEEYKNLDFKPLIKEALHLAGSFNLAGYVSFLGALDLQRALFDEGCIYVGVPPLYKVERGKHAYYCYDEEELKKLQASFPPKASYNIQRFKGLGEMMPAQLWETTMDPKRRLLKQLVVEDAAEANVVFSSLMGVRVDGRKKLIQNAASFIDIEQLDI